MSRHNNIRRKAFLAAFPSTLPILAAFSFLGLAYGIYMNISGFSVWYPLSMSLVVYGGSLEFVMVSLLLSPFAPLATFLLALMIQARHIFYGLAMLEKYKDLGWKRFYLIFALCDETFSINYSAKINEDVDRGWFYFFVSLLNHLYWFLGAVTGGIVGSLLTIDTTGLEFVMTALFIVIFLDQWRKETKHQPALIGILSSIISLLIFGPDSFLLPAMILILLFLTLRRENIERTDENR